MQNDCLDRKVFLRFYPNYYDCITVLKYHSSFFFFFFASKEFATEENQRYKVGILEFKLNIIHNSCC